MIMQDKELKVFKASITYEDNEGWITANKIVFAYSINEVGKIIRDQIPSLPKTFILNANIIVPEYGLIV